MKSEDIVSLIIDGVDVTTDSEYGFKANSFSGKLCLLLRCVFEHYIVLLGVNASCFERCVLLTICGLVVVRCSKKYSYVSMIEEGLGRQMMILTCLGSLEHCD